MMRALIQRDLENNGPQVEYLLSKAIADHPSLRYVGVWNLISLIRLKRIP